MGYFKYVIEKDDWSMYDPEDYNWLQRLWLRLQGYKIKRLEYDENDRLISA